jgi:hypothetical protein
MAFRPGDRTGIVALAGDLVAVLAAAVLLMLPPLFWSRPDGHSYIYNVVWIVAFADELAAGVPYPRWLGELWLGAGGADFFFYAPLPFWLGGAIRLFVCPDCGADRLLVLVGVVLLAASGASFRLLARRFAGRGPALAAAIVYMALPYHLGADWYDREALGEFAAAAILPVHLLALLDCLAGRGGGPRLALYSALLLLSHLPTAVIAATGYLAVVAFGFRPQGWRPVATVAAAGVLGLGIAAIYWVPAVVLLDSVRSDLLAVPQLSWSINLLMPMNLGRSPFFDSLWLPFAILSFAAIGVAALAGRGTQPLGRVAMALLMTVWVMVTPLSTPAWDMTPIARIQFPWRFMVLADLAFAMAALAGLEWLASRSGGPFRRGALGVLLCLIAAVAVAEHPAVRGHRDGSPDAGEFIRVSAGAIEWLPEETAETIGVTSIWHLMDLAAAADSGARLVRLDGPGEVRIRSETSRRLVFEVDAPEPVTTTLHRTYWRYWRLTEESTGRALPLAMTADFPLIQTELPAGRATYVLDLPSLPAERAGTGISGLALLLALGWWGRSRRRRES